MCFSTKTSGETTPPDYVKDYYPGYLDSVKQLTSQQAPLYAGVTYASQNPWQDTAGQMGIDKMLYSNPQTQSARGYLSGITNGQANNPYTDPGYTEAIIGNNARDMTDSFARGTAANTNAAAARSGAYGGSAHNELAAVQGGELAKSIGDMAMRTRLGRLDQSANLFAQDRAAGMTAAGMAPAFDQIDMQDILLGNQLGGQKQQEMQGLLDTAQNQWKYEQQYPFDMAKFFGDRLAQSAGGYGNSSSVGSKSWLAALLGG